MILKGLFAKISLKITILPPDLAQKCNLGAKVEIGCNISLSYRHLYNSKRHRCVLEWFKPGLFDPEKGYFDVFTPSRPKT